MHDGILKLFDEYMQQWPDADGLQQLFIEQVFLGGIIAGTLLCKKNDPAKVNDAACKRALELLRKAREQQG